MVENFNRADLRAKEAEELLLKENDERWVILPIKYSEIWDMFKQHETAFWTAENFQFNNDVKVFKTLNANIQNQITYLFACAAHRGMILTPAAIRSATLLTVVQAPEARAFYSFQMSMEVIHEELFCLLLQEFTETEKKVEELLDKAATNSLLKVKSEFIEKHMTTEAAFAEYLVAMVIQKIILTATNSFAANWAAKKRILPTFVEAYGHVHRDEILQSQFSLMLYNTLQNKIPREVVCDWVSKAVELETSFFEQVLRCEDFGITQDEMKQYVQTCGDMALKCVGEAPLFKQKSPWVRRFEVDPTVSIAPKDPAAAPVEELQQTFSVDEDF